MKPMNNLDYVKVYSKKMRLDKSLFDQQKRLIEDQLKSSSSLFREMFKNKDFKLNARKYLKSVGLIKTKI